MAAPKSGTRSCRRSARPADSRAFDFRAAPPRLLTFGADYAIAPLLSRETRCCFFGREATAVADPCVEQGTRRFSFPCIWAAQRRDRQSFAVACNERSA